MSPIIAWSTGLVALVWLLDAVAGRLRQVDPETGAKRPSTWLQPWLKISPALFALLATGALLLSPDDLDLGFASAPLQAAGLLLAIASTVITLRARVELGESYAADLRVSPEQPLVTRGLYALVRHPIYLGTIGIWLGAGAGMLSWLLLATGLLVMVPTLYLAARREDELLRDNLGGAYREYEARVPMLLPWPRPSGRGDAETGGRGDAEQNGTGWTG